METVTTLDDKVRAFKVLLDKKDELAEQTKANNEELKNLEQETDFFDDINAALRNDVLKIRSRQTDYLLSVLLNSIMTNYISTISSIDDAEKFLALGADRLGTSRIVKIVKNEEATGY